MTGSPPAVHAARKLRRTMTLPEVLLWQELRGRPGGFKFRRQHAIGAYVVDFFCAASRVAIEVDGAVHNHAVQLDHDTRRDIWLEEQAITTVRFAASRVLGDLPAVVMAIVDIVGRGPARPPLHHRKGDGPPPRAGEESGTAEMGRAVPEPRRVAA